MLEVLNAHWCYLTRILEYAQWLGMENKRFGKSPRKRLRSHVENDSFCHHFRDPGVCAVARDGCSTGAGPCVDCTGGPEGATPRALETLVSHSIFSPVESPSIRD